MSDFSLAGQFVVVDCPSCGMQFALTKDYYNRRLNDHKTFLCPSGHSQYFGGLSEHDKAKKEIDELKQSFDRQKKTVEFYDYKLRYLKGVITKMKKKK